MADKDVIPELQEFIQNNIDKDPVKLRLELSQKSFSFNLDEALIQIECRRKTEIKLKDFNSHPFFLYPDSISAEQASHQAVANYHASLMNNKEIVLDLTAGLGIDALSVARKVKEVIALDIDPKRITTLANNAASLNVQNLKTEFSEAIKFLRESEVNYDVIFVDPSRRGEGNRRLYNLHDCSPDVLNNQELLKNKAKRIFIKASPLLDLNQTIKDFNNISSIKAVGVKGECKELLIELSALSKENDISLEAINLDNEGNVLSYFRDIKRNYPNISVENHNKEKNFVKPNQARKALKELEKLLSNEDFAPTFYLLEPSAMVMKLSPWETLSQRYHAKKIGKSSHIFITSILPNDFPGRVSRIIKILKKQDKKSLAGFPATVVSRNHPLSAESIRKEFKLKEGDQNFIYATRVNESPVMFLSESIPG